MKRDYKELVCSKKQLRQIIILIENPQWYPSAEAELQLTLKDNFPIIANPLSSDILYRPLDNSATLLVRADNWINKLKTCPINLAFSFFKTKLGGVFSIYIATNPVKGYIEISLPTKLKYIEGIIKLWQPGFLTLKLMVKGHAQIEEDKLHLTYKNSISTSSTYYMPTPELSLHHELSADCVMVLNDAFHQLILFNQTIAPPKDLKNESAVLEVWEMNPIYMNPFLT